jgi:hypothetical protein
LLILLLAARCTTWDSKAVTSPRIVAFQVSDIAAIAGNDIHLSWQTEAVTNVAIEVWGFVSYSTPQIQRIDSVTNLPAVGAYTLPMPGVPSAVYLIVDSTVEPDQPPNATLQLAPAFYQPDVVQLQVSETTAHPGDKILVEWATDSIFPLSIKTFFVFATQDRSWIEAAQQFDELSSSGSLTLTIPDLDSDLIGLSFELYYHNQNYTRQISQLSVPIIQN